MYRIVDGDERQVEVWRPQDLFPVVERGRLAWPAGGEPFQLDLRALFRPI